MFLNAIWDQLTTKLRQRFISLNGEGEENQADVYRCYTCAKLLTWNFIRSGKFCCIGRVVPATPGPLETMRLLLFKS